MNPLGKNQQQIEFEVFPKEDKTSYGYLANIRNDPPQEGASINIVFSYQSVIIIFICVLMLLVASFVLGVEKGKLVAKNSGPAATSLAATPNTAPAVEKIETVVQEKLAPEPVAALPAVSIPPQEAPLKSGYSIQVASVKTQIAAKTLSESLIKKGVAAFAKPSGKYIVVLAGNFTRKEDAFATLKQLKKTFSDCFIKKI